MFYFTKSDFKTTVFPVTIFAVAAGPLTSTRNLFECAFWVWLHLLQFNVSNQTLRPEEDMLNKPDRPLPAKRITLEQAIWLRWALVPICIGYSSLYSDAVAVASIAIALLSIMYNELSGHTGHWFPRNCLIALDLGCFELGASLVAGANRSGLDEIGVLSVLLSIAILSTTYQTADFKDCDGDRLIGRKTLPLTSPSIARPSVFVAITAWTIAVTYIWQLVPTLAIVFCGLGLLTGIRFVALKGRRNDQISFYWYNLWLTAVHILPGVWRLMNANSNYSIA